MTRKLKATELDRRLAANYLRKAKEFRDVMNQALSEGRPNAAALNAIHSAISAADSLCVHFFGKRSSSKDHADAVLLLRQSFPGAEGLRQAERLASLLDKKNQVEYEERLFTIPEAANLAKQAERLFDWAASKMGRPV